MGNKKNIIIWKDKDYTLYVILIFIFLILFILLVLIRIDIYIKLVFILLFFLIMVFIIDKLKVNSIGIETSGIRIHDYLSEDFERKNKLILWKEINNLQIENHFTKGPSWISLLLSFLVIKTKNKGKYKQQIIDPKSFVQALKKLKKDYLIDKDSKYLK